MKNFICKECGNNEFIEIMKINISDVICVSYGSNFQEAYRCKKCGYQILFIF